MPCRASTSSVSARLRPRSVPGVRRSLIRARACVTRASMSAARKARRSKMTNALFKKRQSRNRHRLGTFGTRPRLTVFRSGKHIYAQVIDDVQAVTLASASTNEKDHKGKGYNVDAASTVGTAIAE